jgi:4-diphosphocytidyl-2-C-methyl-D-erythritol kinase
MKVLNVRAYAKVNLALEVLEKRLDGFHEVRSVLQTISIWDDLTLRSASGINVSCALPGLENRDNLIIQAAEALRKKSRVRAGATIVLKKGIPIASGLGGGSADAAATLLGLERLWMPDLPKMVLYALAGELGSDVPFFLVGGTALVRGRGEHIIPLQKNRFSDTWLILLCSYAGIPNKTKALYARLTPQDFTKGDRTEELARVLQEDSLVNPDLMVNSFEQVAYDVFPWLGTYRKAMLEAGASRVHLAGSGPTLFAVATNLENGTAITKRLCARGLDARLVHTIDKEN